VQQLIEQCTRLWHDGRQLCEAISLTRNPCKNEVRIFSKFLSKLIIYI